MYSSAQRIAAPPRKRLIDCLYMIDRIFAISCVGKSAEGWNNFIQISCQFKTTTMSSPYIQEVQASEVAVFIAKTYEILNNDEFSKIAYWASSGSEFIIKDVNRFQQIVLPKYFRHSKINSFIRQLNMYGFHKSRADHTKSVFSHPCFLKQRPDLLVSIKRKIKGKTERKIQQFFETPVKNMPEVQAQTVNSKNAVQTGNELVTTKNFDQSFKNMPFNIQGTKQKIHSVINLNCSVNILPQPDLAGMNLHNDLDESDDQASIADKIEINNERQDQEEEPVLSYKFVNPSCFFLSMRQGMN